MKIKHTVAAAVFVTLSALLSSMPAYASLVSIAFNTDNSTNPTGEPLNNLGLQLPGQVGPWEGLTVGPGASNISIFTEQAITVGSVTFRINLGGATPFFTFLGAGDELRSPVVFLRSTRVQSVNWEISGLTASAYNLILFGQQQNGDVVNPADFAILGHDAGNGAGNAVTLDGENDGNFINVNPVAGVIQGTFSMRSGESFSAWSGLQLQAVPVPAAVWLFGTALVGLVGFGKRRKAA